MTALTLASRRTLKPTTITLCQVLFLLVSPPSSSFNPGIYSLFQLAPCFSMLRVRVPKNSILYLYLYGWNGIAFFVENPLCTNSQDSDYSTLLIIAIILT